MLLPKFIYGDSITVAADAKKRLRQLKKGATLSEVVGEMIEAQQFDDILLLNESRSTARMACFRCYALYSALVKSERGYTPIVASITEQSLQTEWGLLGLMSEAGSIVFWKHTEWHGPFAHAVMRHWDSLISVGSRYSASLIEGGSLWSESTPLWYIFGKAGLADEFAESNEMTSERFAGFVRRFDTTQVIA